jgi:tRNA A37 threonylcarbamoyladenosine modification protein TsaB
MSENANIHLALFDKDKILENNYLGQNRELLVNIDNFLQENNCAKEDIKGIMVVVGVGTFTSTRIACVVANTFAFVSNIPLLAIGVEDVQNIQNLLPKLLEQPKGQYISATYSGEPNIGKAK